MIFFRKKSPVDPKLQELNLRLNKLMGQRMHLLEIETTLILENAQNELKKQLEEDKQDFNLVVSNRLEIAAQEREESKKKILTMIVNVKNILLRFLKTEIHFKAKNK